VSLFRNSDSDRVVLFSIAFAGERRLVGLAPISSTGWTVGVGALESEVVKQCPKPPVVLVGDYSSIFGAGGLNIRLSWKAYC